MGGRMRQGWELTKKSWALLRDNKQLFRFPIYAALSALVIVVVAVLPGIYLIAEERQNVIGGLLTAIGIYGASFVGIYFSVGLAATADQIFRGNHATFSDGLKVSNQNLGAIAGWAALSAFVGTILAMIQNSGSIGEAIIGALLSTAWTLISFMAVPVIAFEGLGPFATLKRSASLFKQRWAGQVTGNVAIGGLVFVLGMLPAIALIAGGAYLWAEQGGDAGIAGGALLVVAGIALFAVAALISQAMRSVFGVALYHYAAEGTVPSAFSEAELQSAVKVKGT